MNEILANLRLEANAFSCYRKKRYVDIEAEKQDIRNTAKRNYFRNLEKGLGQTKLYLYSCSVCGDYHMTRHADASKLARERGNNDRVIGEINWR